MARNKYFLPTAAALLALPMVLFTFTDLAISQVLSGRVPKFTYLFELTGMVPALLLAFVCPPVVFFTRRKRDRHSSMLMGLVLFTIAGVACFALVYQTFFYLIHEDEFLMERAFPFVFAAFVAIFILTVFFIGRRPGEQLAKFRSFALAATAAIAVTMISVEALKNIFGRVRPRDLQEGAADFTMWFRINGFTGNKSFPSAHSAYGFTTVIYSLLGRTRKERRILLAAGFCWGTAVALSRVFLGAHFPSDVAAGGFIGLSSAYIFTRDPIRSRVTDG